MERYYQIARCYRDEDFRADRQPEFTQLDVEMSFVEQDDVIALGEQILVALWDLIGSRSRRRSRASPSPTRWRRYGTDKPDLRFGLELVELTDVLRRDAVPRLPGGLRRRRRQPGGASQPRRRFDAWQEWAKQRGAKGLAYVHVRRGRRARRPGRQEPVRRRARRSARRRRCTARRRGLLRRGKTNAARALLGAARQEIAARGGQIDEDAWAFVWVVDAPLFKPTGEDDDVAVGEGAWTAVHHAFTSPTPEWIDTFEQNPGEALAYAYDIVCNGNEIGGGSIRIHRRDVQERVFAIMGIGEAEAQEKFGFLLDAFAFGAPPHGGIAFGWDRIVALLTKLGLDPRRHRVPEVGRRLRPADGGSGADHGGAAQGGRRGRQAQGPPGLRRTCSRSCRRGGVRTVCSRRPRRWAAVESFGDDEGVLLRERASTGRRACWVAATGAPSTGSSPTRDV